MGLMVGGGGGYAEKVLSYGPIAYWPLWELSGVTAQCLVNPAQNGTYTGVILANAVAPDGSVCPFFDGINDLVNIYSAALNTAFDPDEYTIAIWAKFFNVGVWTDGLLRNAIYLEADGTNLTAIRKSATNNRILFDALRGGVNSSRRRDGETTTGWMHWALTVSKTDDEHKAYYNGIQEGVTINGLGNWAGALKNLRCAIGSRRSTPSQPFHGWLAHAVVFDRVLNTTEVFSLAMYGVIPP